MKMRSIAGGAAAALLLGTQVGCDGSESSPLAPGDGLLARGEGRPTKRLGPEVCAFAHEYTLASENDHFPLSVGSYWILEGEDEGTPVRLRIDITPQIEVVGGVETRVLTETEWEQDEESGELALVEVSYNYFAVREKGKHEDTVCYFGEAVDDYEDGEIVSHVGAWRADAPGNRAGIFMPGEPRPGMSFAMEFAPGIAEDEGRIVGSGPVRTPAGRFRETVRLREYNPLDDEVGFKVFAEDVGTVVDGPLRLVEFRVVDEDGEDEDGEDEDGEDEDGEDEDEEDGRGDD